VSIGIVQVVTLSSSKLLQASTRCVGVICLIAHGTPRSKMVESEFSKGSERLRPIALLDLVTTHSCRGLLCR